MIEELNSLREKIDKIDQDLLLLLLKRLTLVSRVGEIKNHFGLRIYSSEREEMIIRCRREEAKALGISSDLVEDVLRRIIRESYYSENSKGFKPLGATLRPIVIIGGKGRIGQLFLKMLVLSGYKVSILDKEDWSCAESILTNVHMILISVPMHTVIDVIHKLPHLPNDCIIVDLSSIKKEPLKIILSIHDGPVLGLHPMFHPEHGNMIKQVILYCNGRYPEAYQWFLKQIELWGAKLYCCDVEEHDQYMGLIQGLCHFITFSFGYFLLKEKMTLKKLLSISSPVFLLELIMMGRLFAQDAQLYLDIITESSNILLIKKYYKRLGALIFLLEKNNKKELMNQFKKIRHWCDIYIDKFLNESNEVLHYINDIRNHI